MTECGISKAGELLDSPLGVWNFCSMAEKNEKIKRRDRLSYDITYPSASGHAINRILLLFSLNRVPGE
jgi:hypothetical protein